METIGQWPTKLGLSEYTADFERNHIRLDLVQSLSDQDLRELGVHSLGHRKLIRKATAELDVAPDEHVSQPQSKSPIATEDERRQLTVLFCDMVGFTELANRVDPEVLQRIIGSYEDACALIPSSSIR